MFLLQKTLISPVSTSKPCKAISATQFRASRANRQIANLSRWLPTGCACRCVLGRKQIYNARSSNIIQIAIYRYSMRTIYAVMWIAVNCSQACQHSESVRETRVQAYKFFLILWINETIYLQPFQRKTAAPYRALRFSLSKKLDFYFVLRATARIK